MSSLLIRRLLMSVVPFSLTGLVVLMAIFGDHGLVRAQALRQQLVETEKLNAAQELRNEELRRQIRLLETEEKGVQRLAAQELLMAPPGATIYRFE